MEEQLLAAQGREERAGSLPEEPRNPTGLGIASCQRFEWARIVHVMTEQRMAVYTPDADPRVGRREEQRVQRKATEAAWSERSDGGLPVEVLRHRVYRITVRPATAPAVEESLVRHVFAASPGAAVEHARTMFGRPGSVYQDREYRIVSVEQVLPEPGELF
ncbi:hypothetical protein ACFVDH_04390 [Streptomyces sp. NPDC057674]|uniref:hypothetical protein n=1 Tax=Streptomyces sp. NPDC057674 TaxID=3346203 RepID=UPI0036901267